MELSVIDKKLAMDSRDIANEKLRTILSTVSDQNFADDFINILNKEFSNIDESGFVYIAYDKTNKFIKIGKAKNPEKRINSLKLSNLSLSLYGYMKCKNYSEAETYLHNYFKKNKVSREFFNITPQCAFEKLCEMQNEYGYQEVNPICVEASKSVANIVIRNQQKKLFIKEITK